MRRPALSANSASLAQEAYGVVRRRILRGEISLGQSVSRRKVAAELGMSRSSFFGFAATTALSQVPGYRRAGLADARTKARKTGGLRTKTSRARKSLR